MTISSKKSAAYNQLKDRLIHCVEADLTEVCCSEEKRRKQLLSELGETATEIETAANDLGLGGLASASKILNVNFRVLEVSPFLNSQLEALVQSWAAPLSAYLHSIGHGVEEDAAVDVIIDFLSDPAWLSPLTTEEGRMLRRKFSEPFNDFESESDFEADSDSIFDTDFDFNMAGDKSAEADEGEKNYQVEFAADVDQGIVEDFILELSSQVESFDRAVEQFLITEDEVQLRVAQRVVHTVKGGANLVGLEAVVELAHELEGAISLAFSDVELQPKLGPIMQEACDCLAMVSEYLDGLGPEPKTIHRSICLIQSFLKSNLRGGAKDVVDAPKEAKVFHLESLIAFNDRGLKKDIPNFNVSKPEYTSTDSEKKSVSKIVDVFSAVKPTVHPIPTKAEVKKEHEHVDGGHIYDDSGSASIEDSIINKNVTDERLKKDALDNAEVSDELSDDLNAERADVILDIKISESQKKSLLNYADKNLRAHEETTKAFERLLTELSKHSELNAQINALGLLEHFSGLQHRLTAQSQAGINIQNLLSDICMSPQNLLSSTYNATPSPELLQALPSQRTLIVGVGSSRACLLSEKIRRIVYIDEKCLMKTPGGIQYHLAGKKQAVSCASLDALLFPGTDATNKDYRALLIFDVDGLQQYGVLVEAIYENSKQRVKPMGPYDYNAPGVIGSTVLEGGAVSPVIDILALIPESEASE